MAYKMVDSEVLDTYFSNIAAAIREKTGTQETYTPAEMPEAILSIISQKELVSIAITKAPNKTTYNANQYFTKTGMVVVATYSDGSTETITNYTHSPMRALTAADTEITISYTEDGITKTTTQPITVNRINPSLYAYGDLGGKVGVGGTATITVNTSSNGAITAVSSDNSQLVVNSVSGKKISVTKMAANGAVSLTISTAQTDTYNACTKTISFTMSAYDLYDQNGDKVNGINMEYQGPREEPIYADFENIYTGYINGQPASYSKVSTQDEIFTGISYNENGQITLTHRKEYYSQDGNIELSTNLYITTVDNDILEIPVILRVIFYDAA